MNVSREFFTEKVIFLFARCIGPPAGFAWLASAGVLALFGNSVAEALALVRHPYLQAVTSHSIVVRWRTDIADATTLRYGLAPDQLDRAIEYADLTIEHEVAIGSLLPATRYFYSVGSGGAVLAGGDSEHYFTTAPGPGSRIPIRFWVVGDSGKCAVTTQGCLDAAAVMSAYLQQAGDRPADFWLMLGDNAYWSGTDLQYTAGLFEVYPVVMRNTPLWPVLGNHDALSCDTDLQIGPYFDAFALPTAAAAGGEPSGTEAYYSFDWGNIHFIGLDSATGGANYTTSGAMYQWLEADLAQNDADWTIAFWHHPPYTKGSHDSDNPLEPGLLEMREVFTALLESYGVDLQLTGHSHSYERSYLIDGHYGTSDECAAGECFVDGGNGDPDGGGPYAKPSLGSASHQGTVYAVVGSSSQTTTMKGHHPIMAYDLEYEGSLLVDVEGNKLDGRFIDLDGQVSDHFQIIKGDGCPVCRAADEVLTSVVFPAGVECQCNAVSSITLVRNVWAESASSVRLRAPVVRLQPGFSMAIGGRLWINP